MELSLERHFWGNLRSLAHFSTLEPMTAHKCMKACFNVKFAQEIVAFIQIYGPELVRKELLHASAVRLVLLI